MYILSTITSQLHFLKIDRFCSCVKRAFAWFTMLRASLKLTSNMLAMNLISSKVSKNPFNSEISSLIWPQFRLRSSSFDTYWVLTLDCPIKAPIVLHPDTASTAPIPGRYFLMMSIITPTHWYSADIQTVCGLSGHSALCHWPGFVHQQSLTRPHPVAIHQACVHAGRLACTLCCVQTDSTRLFRPVSVHRTGHDRCP